MGKSEKVTGLRRKAILDFWLGRTMVKEYTMDVIGNGNGIYL